MTKYQKNIFIEPSVPIHIGMLIFRVFKFKLQSEMYRFFNVNRKQYVYNTRSLAFVGFEMAQFESDKYRIVNLFFFLALSPVLKENSRILIDVKFVFIINFFTSLSLFVSNFLFTIAVKMVLI